VTRHVAVFLAAAVVVTGSTVACTRSSQTGAPASPSVTDTEPSGFLVTAIDGTGTWPPPLSATPADMPKDPIRLHVPEPDSSSDWDWSPDGSKLLWLQYVDPSDGRPFDRLVVSNADGSEPTTLVDKVGYVAYRGRAWSADGRSIAYAVMGNKETGVSVADAVTGATTTVASWHGSEQIDVDWSPDGSQLVVGVPGEGIFTMFRDGSGIRKVSDLPAFRVGWSPQGRIVAEAQGPDDNHAGVWVLGADGSHQQRLSPRGATDLGPVWSPDGQWIAFSRDTELERQVSQPQFGTTVFMMRADGSDVRKIAPAPDDGWREVWDWLPVAPSM
jgi:Tol biopolymer transport system component